MRVLRTGPSAKRSAPRPSRRIYGAAEREALIVLWEASDRVCGKRLKAIIPTLVEAMEAAWSSGAGSQGADGAFEDERGYDRSSVASTARALQPTASAGRSDLG